MGSIKRVDRTTQLMKQVQTAASKSVAAAAVALKEIAREMVSKRYTKARRPPMNEQQLQLWRDRRRKNARKYFTSLPPKQVQQ